MGHYQLRPETVEAVRWSGAFLECDPASFPSWLGDALTARALWPVDDAMHIASPTTTLVAQAGDWLVKRADGTLQPFTADAFGAAFEPVTP